MKRSGNRDILGHNKLTSPILSLFSLHAKPKNQCVHIADTLLHTEEDTKKVRTTDVNQVRSKTLDKRQQRRGGINRKPSK